jgi:hypothetical protein
MDQELTVTPQLFEQRETLIFLYVDLKKKLGPPRSGEDHQSREHANVKKKLFILIADV